MKHMTGELRLLFGRANGTFRFTRFRSTYFLGSLAALSLLSVPAYAADDPWTTGVTALQTLFTGTVAKGLSLVAIVVGGLMFAFGEGGSIKMMSGIVFGVGMAVLAANFLTWLFGV